jgi:hypothetical protein
VLAFGDDVIEAYIRTNVMMTLNDDKLSHCAF